MLRSHLRSASVAIFLTLGIALIGTSCQNRAGDCAETLTCGTGGGNDGTGGETASTGGSAPEGGMGGLGGFGGLGGLGGQGTGGTIEPCDPTQEECVGDVIVHVSPDGDDGSDGSLDAPVQTVAQALTLVAAAVDAGEAAPLVYVCATGEAYEETLTLGPQHGAVGIYGGFDCEGFVASEQRAVLVAADANGHRIEGATGVTLGDLHLESPSATGNEGASSYGLRVIESTGIRILRSDIVAGEGAPGADGMGYDVGDRAEPGAEGNIGRDACEAGASEANAGGPAVTTVCKGAATASIGGKGGAGGGGLLSAAGSSGDPGVPDGGTAGSGENGDECSGGGTGSTGPHGSHGEPSDEFGALTSNGYTPPIGGNGASGGVGEGGGGGGGAAKPTACETGASGGSGGGGGCPGSGASGGQGGGGSFALLSLSSELTVSEVSVVATLGGGGGAGGDGQFGGDRGQGAEGGVPGLSVSNPACRGGNGGFGGNGGSGAGGAGGPSVGVAYVGSAPIGLGEVDTTLPDEGASGGPGGTLNDDGAGLPGLVQATWTP